MRLRICAICKKMFQSVGENTVCPKCMIDNEAAFQEVKDYLRKYPGTTMDVLSEKTGVSVPVLEQYLRLERIEIAPNSPIMLQCNNCGIEIVTGVYCDTCGKSILGQFKKLRDRMETDEKEDHAKLKYVKAKWRSK